MISSKQELKNRYKWWIFLLLIIVVICGNSMQQSLLENAITNPTRKEGIRCMKPIMVILVSAVSGILCDKFGTAKSMLFFQCIRAVGQLLCLVKITIGSRFWIFFFGTIIYESGVACFRIAGMSMVAKYFNNTQLFFGMNFWITIPIIIIDIISNMKTSHASVIFVCNIIGIAATALIFMKDNEYHNSKNVQNKAESNLEIHVSETSSNKRKDTSVKVEATKGCNLPSNYWILVLLFVISTLFGQEHVFYGNKFKFTAQNFARLSLIVSLLMLVIPVIIDKTGKQCHWLFGGFLTVFIANVGLVGATQNVGMFVSMFVGMFIIGLGVCGGIVLPCIAMIVDEKCFGKAFGIAMSISAFAQVIWEVLIHDYYFNNFKNDIDPQKYILVDQLCIACSLIGVIGIYCLRK
eukprot:52531_1